MAPTFNRTQYVDNDPLLFGMDEVRGGSRTDFSHDYMKPDINHRAAFPNSSHDYTKPDINHRAAFPNFSYSTSPDFAFNSASPDLAFNHPHSFPIYVSDASSSVIHSPLWESPQRHHSYPEGLHVCTPNPDVEFGSWGSPPGSFLGSPPTSFLNSPSGPFLHSPPGSFSEPVDIPVNLDANVELEYLNVAAGGAGSFLSQTSWDSLTMSRTESVTSNDAAWEEPSQLSAEFLSTSPFSMIQYRQDSKTNRLAPETGPGRRRPRGRTGPLNEAQRRSTARMREMGACQSCRDRKAKCDSGIPCRQCINYYKCNLPSHPCRDQHLSDIASKLLRGHIFPRNRPVDRYLGPGFRTGSYQFIVFLELGFGAPLPWLAQVVSPHNHSAFAKELLHEHVVYDWPDYHNYVTQRTVQKHLVFPAVLANTMGLMDEVDMHLMSLVNDPGNFKSFPLYKSPLAVLNHVYEYYTRLGSGDDDKQAKELLGKAFKLLNLIHIGGDIRISKSPDSRRIIDHFFAPHILESQVTPCFIRSQLGEVFSALALQYMREVLSALEAECLDKNCRHFASIVCTFMVLFMAVESIQYHTHKDTFHFAYDGAEPSLGPSKDEIDGMVDLLEFYKNCFAGCHRDRLLSATDARFWAEDPESIGEVALGKLRGGIKIAKHYLMERSKESLSTRGGDITVFFDRLVARLLLLEG